MKNVALRSLVAFVFLAACHSASTASPAVGGALTASSPPTKPGDIGPAPGEQVQHQVARQECNGGLARACYKLGFVYANPGSNDATLAVGFALLRRACDLGDRNGCEMLDATLEACRAGDPRVCAALKATPRAP
jgi:hypothetical protein